MDPLLLALRACAEPTRLRLLALAGRGAFCVMEFTEILGQSQPRLSRHLRLLVEAGMMERVREGANVWFTLPHGPGLVQDVLGATAFGMTRCSEADRRQAARVLAERARIASDSFPPARGANGMRRTPSRCRSRRSRQAVLARAWAPTPGHGCWISAPAPAGCWSWRRRSCRARPGRGRQPRDAGAGALPPGAGRNSPIAPCARPTCTGCRWRKAGFDTVVLQMVLHYAEDPAAAVAEAARMLRPEGYDWSLWTCCTMTAPILVEAPRPSLARL